MREKTKVFRAEFSLFYDTDTAEKCDVHTENEKIPLNLISDSLIFKNTVYNYYASIIHKYDTFSLTSNFIHALNVN